MASELPIEIWLDNARTGNEIVRHFSAPISVIEAKTFDELEVAFASLERMRAAGHYLAGYCAYELGYALEPRLQRLLAEGRDVPLLWFGVFARCDVHRGADALRALQSQVNGRCYAGPLMHAWDAGDYSPRFQRVESYIAEGDIYQANLSFRSAFAAIGDPMALYLRLREQSKAAHGAFLCDGERYILSLSPELFFSVSSGREILTKPMKGTAPRAAEPAEDELLKRSLRDSAKDRAENLMIVDLLRNDLSRIARTGTVQVEDLFVVETYPTVHQMVSTVGATLETEATIRDLLRALFPCGSVTGAPKIRAMQIIDELETTPRGVYCGAIGCFTPDGSADFNVAIRTLTIADGKGQLGVGGAIVHDSQVASEYSECLLKARYYEQGREKLELIETLHFSPRDGFIRLDRHLARMQKSALAFAIKFDRAAAEIALRNAVAGVTTDQRVRLALRECGSFSCKSNALPQPSLEPWRYRFSSVRMSSADILLQHKTNWRHIYEEEFSRAGADEVLFINERGRITEGSRTNVFIRRDGRLVTPGAMEGLLCGCLRQEMLDSGTCVEGVVYPEDLERADEVFLGNSLRGLVRAVFASA